MSIKINSLLLGSNLKKMLRPAKINPFPGVIGTFMGRDAFSLAVSCLDLGVADTVLLPAYLCREQLKPFLGKTRVVFYDLQPDLTVDPEEIRRHLARDRVKMIKIINYFGFLQPYRKEIKNICADSGVVVMEDCAHSLLTEGSGKTGDLLVYSFRKIIPIPDGGGLQINIAGKAFTPDFYPRVYSNILSILIMLKTLLNVRDERFSRAGLTGQTENFPPQATSAKTNSRILPLSSFAYNGMGNMPFPEIIERRRCNYQFWQTLAQRTDQFTPVFKNLPSGVCPFGFPVKVKDRNLLTLRLREAGIPFKIHWRSLPEAVGPECVNSRTLTTQMLTLPVYPALGPKEREKTESLLVA